MSFFDELKRRNVFRVGIAYVVTSWLLIQVADILFETIGTPPWVMQAMFVILLAGLVITLIFAWAFELTPEGVKKEKDVDRSQSIVSNTGRKLDRTIIVILVLALGYFVADKFWLSASRHAQLADTPASVETEASTAETIAVLPFVDMSQEGDNEYFSDGLTEELLNILAKIKELRVAGRTSSFAFKGKNEDLRSIGEKLNVATILEGSVRKDAKSNRVRITAQLVSVDDGYHLWSETYDRDLEDIFAIQEEIARKVAKALRVTLLGEDEERIAAQAVTDMTAYDLYLRGLQQLNNFSFDSIRQSIETFGKAIEQDPDYIPAKLHLAKAWLDLSWTGAATQSEAVEYAQPLLTSVLEKDPTNSDAHVLMSRVEWFIQNDDARLEELKLALNTNPRNVDALREMGRYFISAEPDIKKGIEYIREAERIDPYSVDVLWDLIAAHSFAGNPDPTLAYAKRIGEIQPDSPNRYWGPGLAYQLNGQLAKALNYQIKATELDPDDYELTAGIASSWVALGDLEQAEFWAQKADEIGADQPVPIAARVQLYQYREQYSLATDLAQRALELELDNRLGSQRVIRRVFISNLVRQGEIQQSLDFYQARWPGPFETPMDVNTESRRNVNQLLEIAVLLQMQAPNSQRSMELIDAAEIKMQLTDENFLPQLRLRDRAMVAAARKNNDLAIEYLTQAYERGLRYRWRVAILSNIAFNSLHDEPEFKNLIARIEQDMEKQREEAYQLPGVVR